MRSLWLCDKCGKTFEVDVIQHGASMEKVEPRMPILFRQHDGVHKAKGENYAWIVLNDALS